MFTTSTLCALLSFAPVPAPQEDAPADVPTVDDEHAVSRGSVTTPSGPMTYRTEAGRLVLREENGDARASVFYVSYTVATDRPDSARPLTFCFNGGPGSSSVWLHLGAFGPRRVDMGADGLEAPRPYGLVENPHTLLPWTDLVFVDPVGTGFSRAAEGVDESDFHGVEEDVESVGEFIRLHLTRTGRWDSPIYLAGESYGTTRAANLAEHLESSLGIYPEGLVLVSAILNFQTARFDRGNDLPYVLFLPTYTATAWYHGALEGELAADLGATLAEVEAFAANDYTLALMRGDRLAGEERRHVAERLARYTGLDADFVEDADLRVSIGRFVKELLREEGRTVGRLDSRFQGWDVDDAGERYEYDPSYAAIQGPYTMALNDYVRSELGFESDLEYEILTGRVHPWNYEVANNRYLNVAEDLRRAMTHNPRMRVFVANGYYDLATPYFATHYTFDHLGLPAELAGNVQMAHYESGHMMYVRPTDLAQLTTDLAGFYTGAEGGQAR